MMLQATINGAVSGDYLIVVLVGATGAMIAGMVWFLVNHFVSVLKEIRVSLETMHASITEIEREQAKMRQDHALLSQRVDSFDSDGLAETIFFKLRQLQEMR